MGQDVEAYFETNLLPDKGTSGEQQIEPFRYAAAALLIACARSDFEEDPDEEDVILDILRDRFNVGDEILDRLVEFADTHTGTEGLDVFTNLVNKHYQDEQKLALIGDLWKVAYADGRIDTYEETFIHRVAGLLEISQELVQQAKALAAG